jgi:excisionase family DNA binding protein
MPKYFTCPEIASMYGVKTLTVWDWIRKKKLSAIKIGKEYRIRQEDIDAFESKHETV